MRLDRGSRSTGLAYCAAAYGAAALAAWVASGALSASGPIASAAAADLAGTLVVFLFSLGADNSSIYDPYWSIAPPVLGLSWLLAGGWERASTRGLLCLGLVLIWSVRLTANWIRRWRGLSHEDWRYADWRGGPGYWLISLAGFHLMPTVLVFLGSVSLYAALSVGGRPPGLLDVAAVAVTAVAIVIEAVADLQLRAFLRARQRNAVLHDGLWALSRHPNYFGEVLFWWGLWLFALAASPRWWWTVVGPAAITALFLGISVPMMDRHMLARHAGYESLLRKRSAFVPWFPGRAVDSEE